MTDKKSIVQQDEEQQEVAPYEGTERTRTRRAYIPRADIYETDDAIVAVTDIPGASESGIDITLEKNILTIRAYPIEETVEGLSLIYSEFGSGDFERRFTLSDEIDREKIEARVKNGVLTLRLPKAAPAKARKIAVKTV